MQPTSIKAYHEIEEQLPHMRAVVYSAFLDHLATLPEGCFPTANELQAHMARIDEYTAHAAGCWKRLSELADKHSLIRRGPARQCQVTGRSAIQWMLPERAARQLEFEAVEKTSS